MLDADKTGESNLSGTPAANFTLELNHQQLRFFSKQNLHHISKFDVSRNQPLKRLGRRLICDTCVKQQKNWPSSINCNILYNLFGARVFCQALSICSG